MHNFPIVLWLSACKLKERPPIKDFTAEYFGKNQFVWVFATYFERLHKTQYTISSTAKYYRNLLTSIVTGGTWFFQCDSKITRENVTHFEMLIKM